MSWLSEAWRWYSYETPTGSTVGYPHAGLINPVAAGFGALLLIAAAIQQARVASGRHHEQTIADRQRRISESFSKAVELLGSNKIESRFGGIYTLERILGESPEDYWPVIDTLSAFVRRQSPREDLSELPSDIAAALSVIVPRARGPSKLRAGHDGRYAKPGKINLSKAQLRLASLDYSDLTDADLFMVHFEDARLFEANLTGADLRDAKLIDAKMRGADLTSAKLHRAKMHRANLNNAVLKKAELKNAELTNATLVGAKLYGVDLSSAIGLSKEQLGKAEGDETTICLPELRPDHWVRSNRRA